MKLLILLYFFPFFLETTFGPIKASSETLNSKTLQRGLANSPQAEWLNIYRGRTRYRSRKCQCQRLEGRNSFSERIVGGSLAVKREFPSQVYVRSKFSPKYIEGCGGTLLNSRWVLTAAHCAKSYKYPGVVPTIEVMAGQISKTQKKYKKNMHKVSKIIVHEGYTRGPTKNDLALLKLKYPVKFSHSISPACLPKSSYMRKKKYNGSQRATAVGWGRTIGHVRSSSNDLKKVTLTVYSGERCSSKVSNFKWSSREVDERNLCAYRSPQNICSGDSGGQLIYRRKGHDYVIGVASFVGGKGKEKCIADMAPGVFVNVGYYIDWIEKNMGGRLCSV